MQVEDITFNDRLALSAKHRDVILSSLHHETSPDLLVEGRSTYLLLHERGLDDIQFRRIRSCCLKLKGGGHVQKEGNRLALSFPAGEKYLGPTIDGHLGIIIHMGVDDDGHISPIIGKPKINGGMAFSKAKNEYHITNDALEKRVGVCVPVAFGRYDVTIDEVALGFVILGARDSFDRRTGDLAMADVSKLFGGRLEIRFSDYVRELAGDQLLNNAVSFFHNLKLKQGKNLRAFHSAGFARHAGHAGNYQIDELRKSHVMLDLDSSIRNTGNTVFMTRVLDVMSALRGIHEEYCMTAMGFIDDNYNPYLPFLRGYFSGLKKGDALINRSAQELLDTHTKPHRALPGSKYHTVKNSFSVVAVPFAFDLMARIPKLNAPYDKNQLITELCAYVLNFNTISQEIGEDMPFDDMVENILEKG